MLRNERDVMLAERIFEDISVVEKRATHFSMTEELFCGDRSFEGEIAYDAIMNPVYRIVEDACHLSGDLMNAYPSFEWREMRGFRNFVAHGYGAIDRRIAWHVIETNLPELKSIVKEVLSEKDGEERRDP